jgi:hypothetical protein
LSTGVWSGPHRPQDRLCDVGNLGAGDRLAGARVAVGSPDCVTARQGCALARICPHCAALVEPSAKIHLPDLRAGRLFPKVGTLARRSLVCSVLALHFSQLEHGPTFWGLGAYRRDRARPAWRDWPPDSSPHEAARSSPRLHRKAKAKRALQRMALAVPLLARIRNKNGPSARFCAEAN